MQKTGKLPTFCDGIQAHLSTCASPKVLETVNKFSDKILLEEVSRLKTWPTQFLENCATEDHIALYFFAEDLERFFLTNHFLESTLFSSFHVLSNLPSYPERHPIKMTVYSNLPRTH